MAVHIAKLTLAHVTTAGEVKQRTSMTLGEAMTADLQQRIIPSADLPNTADSPTLEDYLDLEDAGGFNLIHLDQTYVITSDA